MTLSVPVFDWGPSTEGLHQEPFTTKPQTVNRKQVNSETDLWGNPWLTLTVFCTALRISYRTLLPSFSQNGWGSICGNTQFKTRRFSNFLAINTGFWISNTSCTNPPTNDFNRPYTTPTYHLQFIYCPQTIYDTTLSNKTVFKDL